MARQIAPQEKVDRVGVARQIIGMRYIVIVLSDQFLLRIADDAAKLLVDAEEAAFDITECDADRRVLERAAEPLLAFPQGCFGALALEYCRRLVGAHAEEQTVFFAGKAGLLRARDQYPVSSVVPNGDDDQACRPAPCGVRDGGRWVGTATIQPGC